MSLPDHNAPCRIFRAPWVVPVIMPVLSDGAVIMDRDVILDVGSFADISTRYPNVPVTNCPGVLLPALVNAHIHLELSVYGPVVLPPGGSMCDWISSLLKIRQAAGFSEHEIQIAAEKAAQKQYESGIGLMLDIGNSTLAPCDSSVVEILSLREMLGPSKGAERSAITAIEDLPQNMAITGHAPYSTTPGLLSYIKKRCVSQKSIFSLHLAENLDEALLLTKAEGCFASFLKERGGFDSTFPIPGIDSGGVVGYLQKLGILDEKSLCVHCVHMTHDEMQILSDSQAHVCLCPGSNRFLSVGIAPLEDFLELKILPALGTDSIASNPSLDLWNEMKLLRSDHPGVAAETVLKMATLGGAMALHRENDYGSLAKGRYAKILHVDGIHHGGIVSEAQLFDRLTSYGKPDSIEWLSA